MNQMRISKFYNDAGRVFILAAILFLVMPAPSAGGPCDCSSCSSVSKLEDRCLCCVYHGVGGKRSLSEFKVFPGQLSSLSPPLHFLLTAGLLRTSQSPHPASDSHAVPERTRHGSEDVSSPWLEKGEPNTEEPVFQHRVAVAEPTAYGFAPTLTIKSSENRKEAPQTSDTADKLRRFILRAGAV